MCNYLGNAQFVSMMEPSCIYQVNAKKIVDSTQMRVDVPSCTPPPFPVENASIIPPNGLGKMSPSSFIGTYVVIGAGKTGMDAILWLLNNEVEQSRIKWIMPNDAWLLNRDFFIDDMVRVLYSWVLDLNAAKDVDEVFELFAKNGHHIRLDKDVPPVNYRCATVSPGELKQLRTLKNIIRKGRVSKIKGNEIIMKHGSMIIDSKDILYVNCTSAGIKKMDPIPVFQNNEIVLQPLRYCQPVFSAAMIAFIEARIKGTERKNSFCQVVPYPKKNNDGILCVYLTLKNELKWMDNQACSSFLSNSRLNWILPTRMTWGGYMWLIMNFRTVRSKFEKFVSKVEKGGFIELPHYLKSKL